MKYRDQSEYTKRTGTSGTAVPRGVAADWTAGGRRWGLGHGLSWLLAAGVGLILLAGCTGTAAKAAKAASCVPGAKDCACATGSACSPGLTCAGGICTQGQQGDQGMACYANLTCNAGSDGRLMLCVSGLCQPSECRQGAEGCGCQAGQLCDPGLSCSVSDGVAVCQAPDCTKTGGLGCACNADLSCAAEAPGTNITCDGKVCVTAACTPGSKGCYCGAKGTCESGLACDNTTFRCQITGCTAGTLSCACAANDACFSDKHSCDPTTKRCVAAATCVPGMKNCLCKSDGSCDVVGGAFLTCESGTCKEKVCSQGKTGCPCTGSGGCISGDAICDTTSKLCVSKVCKAGAQNCACEAGGKCSSGLVCAGGKLCVSKDGFAGGKCLTGNVCNTGAKCTDGTCAACSLGGEGCGCFDNGNCLAPLNCHVGTCVSPGKVSTTVGSNTPAPTNPTCWTPCSKGITKADGSYQPCGADGLMAGCIDDKVCDNGTCLAKGEKAPACSSDLQCPEHQTCYLSAGHCFSNCDYDSDCPGTLTCYRHVCRKPCKVAKSDCAKGQYCKTNDGINGTCLALAAPKVGCKSAKGKTISCDMKVKLGSMRLSPESHEFSTAETTMTTMLRSDSLQAATYTIRKVAQRVWKPSGLEVICLPGDAACPCSATDKVLKKGTTTYYCDVNKTPPMPWLSIAIGSAKASVAGTLTVTAPPGQQNIPLKLKLTSAAPKGMWLGEFEVSHPEYGTRRFRLRYSVKPDGRWVGTMYSFATFEDDGIAQWVKNPSKFSQVKNAFIQQWALFRKDPASRFEVFQAMQVAVQSESWTWQTVAKKCASFGKNSVCIPYAPSQLASIGAQDGVFKVSSDARTIRMPSGVVEMPITMELISNPKNSKEMNGRILSASTMQYTGDPAIKGLTFEQDPVTSCSSFPCVIGISKLEATIGIGGRYITTAGDTACSAMPAGTHAHVKVPWLLTGFLKGTEIDPQTKQVHRYECRSKVMPFSGSPAAAAKNVTVAASNPVPDGRARVRKLTLLDGALLNQTTMVLLFREVFPSFIDDADTPIASYGYIVMRRAEDDVKGLNVSGNNAVVANLKPKVALMPLGCDPELEEQVLGKGGKLSDGVADAFARSVVKGDLPSSAAATELDSKSKEMAHYYCESTGLLDGGETDYAHNNAKQVPCPVGSKVRYFTLKGPLTKTDCPKNWTDDAHAQKCQQELLASLKCQKTGTCIDQLNEWKAKQNVAFGKLTVLFDPVWRCVDTSAAWCSNHRADLRKGKRFFSVNLDATRRKVFEPLLPVIDQAFRYKTQFRNRFGKNIGFTPQICLPDSNQIPYCYDPAAIESLRRRVDCVAYVYLNHNKALKQGTRDSLLAYLKQNYGYTQIVDPATGAVQVKEGFEKLYAELLIMLGDDSYTSAFASRFDIAGASSLEFEGDLFEPNGLKLSGSAGYEMVELYRATQYYQLALDRFFRNAPLLWMSLDPNKPASQQAFLGQRTVEAYFRRVVRASIQKTRAWSAVSQRYNGLNRPDLARLTIERAYTAAYLESVILGRLMMKLLGQSKPSTRDQILRTIEKGQTAYRSALLDMRQVYKDINEDKTLFGFQPDYIPFPAIDLSTSNAFLKSLKVAQEKLAIAAVKESKALLSKKSYETDSAAFQNELVRIRNNYDNQLGDLCGTFVAADGKVYPAISKYGYLHKQGAIHGNICGLVGNGGLYQAYGRLDQLRIDFKLVAHAHNKLLTDVKNERKRVSKQCKITTEKAKWSIKIAGKKKQLKQVLSQSQDAISTAERLMDKAATLANLTKCTVGTSTDCPMSAFASGVYLAKTIAQEVSIRRSKKAIASSQNQLSSMQTQEVSFSYAKQCEVAQIDSEARVKSLFLAVESNRLDILKAQLRIELALAEIESLRNRGIRLMAEQSESEQLTINLEAAKNDPNTRIYKNDDIITADRTFSSALKEAYKATRVYEYYTSTSYGKKIDLFLVRMVAHGDKSLEAYLSSLQDAFNSFEESYGKPDQRVAIISLRDDILSVPTVDENGAPLSQAGRIQKFRDLLANPALLNNDGYISIAFPTSLVSLSPLTRNHKIDYVEAELVGSDVGDTLGRIYLAQRGTSSVRTVGGENVFYAFPERVAVINTFFNGHKVFPPAVYQSRRHKDRPYASTNWGLLINQKDELVNQDINLQSLVDLRIYLYYTDFTSL